MLFLTLALAILIPVLAVFTKGKWKDTNWAGRVGLITAILLTLVAAYSTYKKWRKDELIEKVESRFGIIDDLDGATFPKIAIGPNNDAAIDWIAFVKSSHELLGYTAPFRLYIKEDKLFIDIVVRDRWKAHCRY